MSSRSPREYDDDFFKDTRMTFGEHIEELRGRLWKAIIAVGVCLVIGFVLDGIGSMMGWDNFGIGKPALGIITEPVKEKAKEYYNRQTERALAKYLEEEKKRPERAATDIEARIDAGQLAAAFPGLPPPAEGATIAVTLKVPVTDLGTAITRFQQELDRRSHLTALSPTEGFFIYIKVSLLCGVVIASPIVFYQIWAFIAAGLYPHEKRHVHVYLPFSLGLFLGGVCLCQFVVMPLALEALFGFNAWLNVDPDIRLSEWLWFALVLPLVFGISFQTPLVMLFLNRIGMFRAQDYQNRWRHALIVLFMFAALITPTGDAMTMLMLAVPMFALYWLGIGLCYRAQRYDLDIDVPEDEEVAV